MFNQVVDSKKNLREWLQINLSGIKTIYCDAQKAENNFLLSLSLLLVEKVAPL